MWLEKKEKKKGLGNMDGSVDTAMQQREKYAYKNKERLITATSNCNKR